MKIIKARLRNKIEDNLFIDYTVVSIEKKNIEKITNMIINDFHLKKQCQKQLKK